MTAAPPSSPLAARLLALGEASSARLAVVDDLGSVEFGRLVAQSRAAAFALAGFGPDAELRYAGSGGLDGRRVAILASPGASWLAAFLGVVLGGGIALPLSPLYPPRELAWFLEDAGADFLVVSDDQAERAHGLGGSARPVRLEDLAKAPPAPDDFAPRLRGDDAALLLYTSGTTGKPKGAIITHDNLFVQAELLRAAWGWSERDVLLHALPLHHLHGLGISLLTSLLAGATARMLPRFDATRVWNELGACSAWMAVPTMYQKLFEAFDAADEATRGRWREAARGLRIATSGSAALPVTLAERWRELTGSIPLERFGMTEIGVGMSNPLDPAGRRAGWVGPPLPTVELRLVDEAGQESSSGPAEVWIRGPSVFPGYWRREDATRAAFTDGWFRTGDVAVRGDDGMLRILGRTSVDILKSGGYKLSALEIEETLREHPAIAEVAVVGVPDETWGDRVVAVVVAAPGRAEECAEAALRAWARERLAPYKVPRQVVLRTELPRNAVGKVVKPELVRLLG